MIGNLTVNISAKDPTRKCETLRAFLNSPSTVRIVGVPSALGKWKISKVYFTVNYPDNTSVSKECTAGVGVYVATVAGSTSPGKSTLGYTVKADGTDETGSAIVGYVLGAGDVEIADTDGTVTTGETTWYIHVLDSCPTSPKKGDAYVENGTWKYYNGTAWTVLGGVSAGNSYVMAPVANGGDGKWHRMLVVEGTLAYDQEGIDDPPLAADKTWVTTQIAAEATARNAAIAAHTSRTDNPHSVTKTQIGLGNCDNTSDANKPVSTAQAAAIASAIGSEVTNRNSAIAAEATARQNAVSAEATARQNAVSAEAAAREEADDDLSDDIAAEATRATAAETAEAAARAAADATKVSLDGAQTVNGVKTFTSSPVVPTPTANMQAATKKYADDAVAAETYARSAAISSAIASEVTNRNSAIATAVDVSTSGNNLVHKTGAETISGEKTFSSQVVCSSDIVATNSYCGFYSRASHIRSDTTPSSRATFKQIVTTFADAPNTQRQYIEIGKDTDGSVDVQYGFHSQLTSDSDDVYNILKMRNDRNLQKRVLSYNGESVTGSAFAAVGMPNASNIINNIFDLTTTNPTYTAPANGWIVVIAYSDSSAASDAWASIRLASTAAIGSTDRINTANTLMQVMAPVRKGTLVTLYTTRVTTGTYSISRFIYANAE